MDSLKLNCPAKLNLNLSVLSKRTDGMHEIKTQFQLINLFDEMLIKKTSSTSISVKTNLGTSIDGEENIVFDAVRSLSNYIGKEIHCDIEIVKNIPLGGGLGGGSSNAAAALIGINFLFKLGLSFSELMKLGKKLGADVPFFIFGKNAHASGIGEKLSEEIKHSNKKYLLLFPQVHSSTKELFSEWDDLSKDSQESILMKEENSFLPIFLEKNQDIKKIFNELNKNNSFKLSGTGSTIFCAYNDQGKIEKTLKKIPTKWRHSFCEPLQCSPLLTYLK
ncbi:4-(cytidine 5'-diphospho)-2-C-methyl-D-erythritol kinase [Gammaproteobacteria bacterium]|jgi:4-diphosphocytidyl-2-C-methyl-D-erythritol kinase|nr:4-(cytidine 5'-diphospho)-2-C-methyl-D-erythritol kinase [Gammaproteobacteria bacterium]